jgi:hypothetical protein
MTQAENEDWNNLGAERFAGHLQPRIEYHGEKLGLSYLWVVTKEEEEEAWKMADVERKQKTNVACDRLHEGRRYILHGQILK